MFYNKTNKKEYNLQIWQNNIRYTNIISVKNIIILKKASKIEELSGGIADKIAPAKVAWALTPVDLAWRYKWTINNAHLDEANGLGLTSIKKYWRRAGQV